MGSVLVVSPIIIASWPVIAQAVSGVAVSLGFSIVRGSVGELKSAASTKNRTEIEVADSEVLAEEMGRGEDLVIEKDGVTARFYRDGRGALRLCLDGNRSKRELEALGAELLGRVTQQYVYHRLMTELNEKGVTVLDEEVAPDRTVKIRVRAW